MQTKRMIALLLLGLAGVARSSKCNWTATARYLRRRCRPAVELLLCPFGPNVDWMLSFEPMIVSKRPKLGLTHI